MTDHNVEVIDDALPVELFNKLVAPIESDIEWKYQYPVANADEETDQYYLYHMIYDLDKPKSDYFDLLFPVLRGLDVKSLLRVKLNFYPRTETVIKHEFHTDYDFPHKGALLFLNTNDGVTSFDDGTEVESVANRLMIFDPSVKHCSSTCTNQPRRLTMNFNFF